MHTLICFALKEEAAPFQKIAAGKPDVSILLTGIGRVNAEKSLREFLAGGASLSNVNQARLARTLAPPELVFTCGFAGGLKPDLKIGDVIFESGRSRGDETQIKKESETPHVVSYEKLISAGAKSANFFCAGRIAITVAEKKKLRDETGADAVEMESAAIQEICRAQKIPCATVRVISDTANENLPLDFNAFAKPDKNLDFGKLALAIAKSPGKIFALKKLQKQTQFAAQQLAHVLQKIIFP